MEASIQERLKGWRTRGCRETIKHEFFAAPKKTLSVVVLSSGAFGLAGLCFEGTLVEAMTVTLDDITGFVRRVVLCGQFIEKIAL